MILNILKDDYANLFNFFTFLVLFITLIVLLGYAYDTKIIARQTKDSNLRPVILRSGYLENWSEVKFSILNNTPDNASLPEGNKPSNTINNPLKQLEFTILKNIAKDINGFVVLDGKRYNLLFGNEISQKIIDVNQAIISFNPNWGWMRADKKLYAILDSRSVSKSGEKNKIQINYADIEGNKYFTIEDENFSSTSLPLEN